LFPAWLLIKSLICVYRSTARRMLGRRWHVPETVWETLNKNGHLGFTCFGGPPVHFQIVSGTHSLKRVWPASGHPSVLTLRWGWQFHKKFVEKYQWLNEPMFQELFAVTQALSGPASTKMLYCINLNRNGLISAMAAFLMWS
jgi:hypothetical protein